MNGRARGIRGRENDNSLPSAGPIRHVLDNNCVVRHFG